MKLTLMLQFSLSVFTLVSSFAVSPYVHAQRETLIPRSMLGDKGKYYLIESKMTGNVVRTLHKRVGFDSVGFTRTETNCKTRQMRELGYGDGAPRSEEHTSEL